MGYWAIPNTPIKYITPNKVVTADSIEDNSNYILEYKDDYTKSLGFKSLNPEEFKDICQHIVKDFFNCNNPMLTMSCFAHAMAAVAAWPLEKAVGFKNAPVLWVAGSFGQGKSFVLENTQYFFGDFTGVSATVNTSGSAKSKIAIANMYRHALLCFDDQKDIDRRDQGQDIVKWVNHTYDKTPYTAMNRDSTLRDKPPRNQGLIAVNGEDFPDKDASCVSRLIAIDVALTARRAEGERVKINRSRYCGFTPRVVQYFLKMSHEDLKLVWDKTYAEFVGEVTEETKKYSVDRIAENLTLNYIGFWAAMQTMYESGGISLDERNGLLDQHKKNLTIIKTGQVQSVANARGSAIFLNSLKELLADSSRYKIAGWPSDSLEDTSKAQVLGFYEHTTPDVVFMYSELTYQAVNELSRKQNSMMQKWGHIARQLGEDGVFDTDLAERKDDKWSCRRRAPGGMWQRVYPFKASYLGLYSIAAMEALRKNQNNSDHKKEAK
jgi:hypothetical protein